MTQPDGLEGRVDALETTAHELSERVRRSEHDAAAARVLAGGADRDVAEFRSEIRGFRDQNNRVLSAMRLDMDAMRSDIVDLRQHVDRGFGEMRGKLDATAAGQHHIVRLLDTLVAGRDED